MRLIDEISEEEAKKELAEIAAAMARADIAYYQNDAPFLSDAEYDSLKQRNLELETKFPHLVRADSPSRKVGAPLQSGFGKIAHRFPMLSLGDVFSMDEVADFIKGVKRFLNTDSDIDLEASGF